jgi:hypothetical protein
MWTVPSEGTWHFRSAPDAPPHPFEQCDQVQCFGECRRGWLGWCAKDAVIDLDVDKSGPPPGGPPVF